MKNNAKNTKENQKVRKKNEMLLKNKQETMQKAITRYKENKMSATKQILEKIANSKKQQDAQKARKEFIQYQIQPMLDLIRAGKVLEEKELEKMSLEKEYGTIEQITNKIKQNQKKLTQLNTDNKTLQTDIKKYKSILSKQNKEKQALEAKYNSDYNAYQDLLWKGKRKVGQEPNAFIKGQLNNRKDILDDYIKSMSRINREITKIDKQIETTKQSQKALEEQLFNNTKIINQINMLPHIRMKLKSLNTEIEIEQKHLKTTENIRDLQVVRSVYDEIMEQIKKKEPRFYDEIVMYENSKESEHLAKQQIDKTRQYGSKEEQDKLQIALENEYRTKLNTQFALDELYGRKRMKKSLSMDDMRLNKINNSKIEENNIEATKTQDKWQKL